MDRKKLLLLVGALIVAIGTAFAARSLFAGAGSPQAVAAAKVPMGAKVLVANRALPAGTIITADAMGYQPWPKDLVQDAYFVEEKTDMAKLLGTVVRHPITAGEPVTQGSLVAPGDRGFLAAALGPGMRAVTIAVSARTAVAGFVFPGDHIDLVLTQTVKGATTALKAAETILENLRVLATDQSTEQEQIEGKTRVRTFSTVTVEATPKIAEKIAVDAWTWFSRNRLYTRRADLGRALEDAEEWAGGCFDRGETWKDHGAGVWSVSVDFVHVILLRNQN